MAKKRPAGGSKKPAGKPLDDPKLRGGQKRRERLAQKSRDETQAVSDIGVMPAVVDPKRRKRCRLDLFAFLVTYFPNSTGVNPFSADHARVIGRMQDCILRGGRFINAVYRGFGKTTIAENASLWAVLYGHRRFVAIFGADAPAADGNIDSIKTELSDNEILYGDFPEACHAIWELEGKPQRCQSQTYREKRTHIEWTADKVVLPTIDGSPSSGAVIIARGFTGGFRGLKHKKPDGTQQRPDLILLDDFQTDESAATPARVSKTLSTITKAILKLGGHQKQIALMANATCIMPDDAVDQLLDPMKFPAWDGERMPMVRAWAARHEDLWLGEYARLRHTYDRSDPADRKRAHVAANEFYREHRAEMDAGCEVSWEHCYDPENELSAIQYAYNALIDEGEEAFASEYQNQPMRARGDVELFTAAELAEKSNGLARGVVPLWASRLTAFIDVQGSLLYYAVCAWGDGFMGAVVDYGTYPEQRKAYFTLRDASPTLADVTGVVGQEAQVFKGLGTLAEAILGRHWSRERVGEQAGPALQVERLLVDAGWETERVKLWARQCGRVQVSPSLGRAPGPDLTPIAEWKIDPMKGERRIYAGVVSPAHVIFDSSAWKAFLFARFGVDYPGAGSMTLCKDEQNAHRLLCDHLTSELHDIESSEKSGRKVDTWRLIVNRENHFLDTVVGCAVAAGVLGVTLGDVPTASERVLEQVSYKKLQQEAKARRQPTLSR